ncbi:CPBP family intramembrane metalloprotease [Actinoplanes sp. LDG1-06]|uniref:CPBP family intramembrane metalloprotease n=1 Tax=Paractinoplanes ovalisporus TaxID=2810368 RepID=A0ABS2AVC7_9ACTN|nr:CPBP family intramembrane glutamic endopeptidase [Actinoplanes ovalisporus]MBM2623827.1 CPBP family intramembrane metalloprotease [Actinoplanes ovalisporus]
MKGIESVGTENATARHHKKSPPPWLHAFWPRFLFLLITFLLVNLVLALLINVSVSHWVSGLLVGVAAAALALFLYTRIVGWLEQRHVVELARSEARSQLIRGTAIGTGLFVTTLALIFACNGYRLHGGSFWAMLATLGAMTGVAVLEELVFRGVLFRGIEERFGTTPALVVSALLFGGLHFFNAEGTVWGALAIAVEGGLMLGAAYVLTRSLWLPIGLHLGWNFTESGIFGGTVSGTDGAMGGLLTGVPRGPAIISGGTFGPEASIFAVLVCGATAVLLLRRARKQGSWR